MHEIVIDELQFDSPAQVHAFLADQLGFPAHYGHNLDALSDCLGDMDETVGITIYLGECSGDEEAGGAEAHRGTVTGDAPARSFAQTLSEWMPKLCRTLLRAARGSDALSVVVYAESLQAFGRLAACPGLLDLAQSEKIIVQGVLACVHDSSLIG